MKLSRGAITLLLAAFRRVYENAYIKGLASAVVLTGGLAAGAAQATVTNNWADSASSVTGSTVVVIDESGNHSGDSTNRYTGRMELSGTGNTYTLDDAGYNLIINGVTVSNGATLKLAGGASIVTGDRLNPDQNEHPIVADTVIRGGNVEIDGSPQASYFQTHDLVLQDGSLKISGSSATADVLSGYSQLWMNHGGTFTMDSGSVELTGTALLGADRGMELNGGTLTLSGSNADQTVLAVTGGEGAALNIHGATFDVEGKASLMADTVNIDTADSVININATTGELTMGGQTPSQSTASGAKYTSATINMSAGTINNSGSLILRAGEGTIDWDNTQGDAVENVDYINDEAAGNTVFNFTGGTLNNAGTLHVRGHFIVGEGANLVSAAANNQINVDASTGAFEISAAKLNSYLKATNKGAVYLTSGGTLTFSDPSVELSDFSFVTSGSSLDSVTAGAINIGGDGTVQGQHVQISKSLGKLTWDDNFSVEAQSLTLGDGSAVSVNSLSDIVSGNGFIKFVSHGDVTLNASGDTFTLDITKEQPFSIVADGDTPARVTGDKVKVGYEWGSTLNLAGNVQWESDLLLEGSTSGVVTFNIGKREDGTTDFAGNTNVSLTGTLTAGASNSGAAFNVGTAARDANNKNYTATLDVTRATLATAEGTGTVNFQANANGELRMSASQINTLLSDSGATHSVYGVTLSGGTLAVDGTLEARTTDIISDNSFAAGKILNAGWNDSSRIEAAAARFTQTSGSDTKLSLYNGDLSVESLEISNLNAGTEAGTLVPKAEMQYGDYYVNSSVTSRNEVLKLSNNAHLNLGVNVSSQGRVSTDLLISSTDDNWTSTDSSAVYVTGTWQVQNVTVEKSGEFYVNGWENQQVSSVTGQKLTLEESASTNDGQAQIVGQATFTSLEAKGGAVKVTGTLNVVGDTAAKNADGTDDLYNGVSFADDIIKVQGGTLSFGEAATEGLVFRDASGAVQVRNGVGKVSMESSYSTLRLNFDASERFSAADLETLKEGLVSGVKEDGLINGTLSVGSGSLAIEGLETGTVTWENFKDFANASSDVTSDVLQGTVITGVDSAFAGQVGAATLASGTESLTLGGNTSFSAAASNNDNFVSDAQGNAADVELNGKDLTLNNGGNLGKVTSSSAGGVFVNGNGQDTRLEGLNIEGNLGVYTGGTLTVGGEDPVKTGTITLEQDSNLSVEAEKAEVTGSVNLWGTGQATFRELKVDGDGSGDGTVTVTAADAQLQADVLEARHVNASWNGTVRVNEVLSLSGGTSGSITVGSAEVRNAAGEITNESSTGTFVAHTLDLNGGTLTLDPAFGNRTALGSVTRFDTTYQPEELDGGVIDGNVEVFRNSALGLGTADENELLNLIKPYQVNGSLTADGVGSVFAATRTFEVDSGKRVILSSEDSGAFKASATYGKIDSDALYLGSHAALLLTDEALVDGTSTEADAPKASVTFVGDNARVVAGGGEIILAGDVKARTAYKLFTDGNDGVSVEDVDGNDVTGENGIRVSSQNGVLMGWLDSRSSGSVTLAWDAARSAAQLSAASDPVISTLAAYANGANDWQNGTPEDTLYNGYKEGSAGADPAKNPDYHNALLSASLNYGHGEGAESAARMAVYGGALDAALAVGETTSQAIASRVGAGNPTSEMSAANNAEGAGLWLAPLFRNASADGFEAQGVDYGVDLDLRGVALGADYALVPNLKAGLMFSLGTGTGEGNGAASLVSNDFDYWSVAAYAGYTYGAFTLSGEVSYAQVDNDLDASTGYTGVGELSASTDSENLSAGINALYQFSFDDLKVTPHVGARFSRLSLDDYTVSCESGNVADFDGDSMNVISLPVGVTLTTESQTVSGWSFVPALDVTLTAHAGDDEFEGDVKWAGVSNLSTATATEVIDTFTYGLSAGLNARNGDSFVMGLGISYEGSDNRDAYGVQATARYTF